MIRLFAIGFVLSATLIVFARQSTETRVTVYTAVQADAGERDFQNNKFGVCANCHGEGLVGRKGEAGELPPLSSLKEDDQKLIKNYGGTVPQLVGPQFMSRWSARSTKDLVEEFKGRFAGSLTEETRLNLIAYL